MKSFQHTIVAILLLSAMTNARSQQPGILTFTDAFGEVATVKHKKDWQQKRSQILKGMEEAMGPLPDIRNLPPFRLIVTDTLITENYTRLTVRFTVAEDEILPAYLYIPKNATNDRTAAMLVLHGTGDGGKKLVDGESPLSNRAVAKELATRGYVVIAPDYPSMGELQNYDFANDRYESGTMKAIFNHIRCVDLLSSLPYVDPERIGVIGHSLGGHNAIFAGAFDQRLKVIVSSCGWTLMDYYNIGEKGSQRYGGRLGPWAQERYMPLLREKFNLDASNIPFDFDEVIAALAPRHFFSNSPLKDSNFDVAGVRQGIASAREVYTFLGAAEKLHVHYPDAGHDFPADVRLAAYHLIDSVLLHKPTDHELK